MIHHHHRPMSSLQMTHRGVVPHITCEGDLHMKHTFMSSISLVIFIFLPFFVYLMSILYHDRLTFASPEGSSARLSVTWGCDLRHIRGALKKGSQMDTPSQSSLYYYHPHQSTQPRVGSEVKTYPSQQDWRYTH